LANGAQDSHNCQISQFPEKLVQTEIAKTMIARNDRLADPGEERYKVERGANCGRFWRRADLASAK
jgi:hypothetical protein